MERKPGEDEGRDWSTVFRNQRISWTDSEMPVMVSPSEIINSAVTQRLNFSPSFLSIVVIKHWLNYFILQLSNSVHHWGSQGKNLEQRPRKNATSRLRSLVSHMPQDHLPRSGPTHSGLDAATLIKIMPQSLSTDVMKAFSQLRLLPRWQYLVST